MAKLTNVESEVVYDVPSDTTYSKELRAWIAGEQRFSDNTGDDYLFEPDAAVPDPPPTVSRVKFKMLWSSAERIETKKLRATDAIIDDFWDLLEDPQTTDVVLSLPSVQQAIEYTLSKIPVSVVPADQRPVRLAEILSGVLK